MGLYGDLPIKINEGTTPDTVIRVSGKGITKLQSRSTKGDHFIHVKINFPPSVIMPILYEDDRNTDPP